MHKTVHRQMYVVINYLTLALYTHNVFPSLQILDGFLSTHRTTSSRGLNKNCFSARPRCFLNWVVHVESIRVKNAFNARIFFPSIHVITTLAQLRYWRFFCHKHWLFLKYMSGMSKKWHKCFVWLHKSFPVLYWEKYNTCQTTSVEVFLSVAVVSLYSVLLLLCAK